MLKILATPPVTSNRKEGEPVPQEFQIFPSDKGIFQNPQLMGGVSIEVASSDQEEAILNIHFQKHGSHCDAWPDGVQNGSLKKIALNIINANLNQKKRIPLDFHQKITLADFSIPTGSQVNLSIMERDMEQPKFWKKLSDIQLTHTPDLQGPTS